MRKPHRRILWLSLFVCVVIGVVSLVWFVVKADDELMNCRRLRARVVSLQQDEEETAKAMEEIVLKLQEYQSLLKSVEDRKGAQNLLERAIIFDRETNSSCKKYHELTLKRIELDFAELETLLQLRTKNTFLVRMLKTQKERELEKKSRKVVRSPRVLGAHESMKGLNRERSRIRKLMDETWAKEWFRLTELEW